MKISDECVYDQFYYKVGKPTKQFLLSFDKAQQYKCSVILFNFVVRDTLKIRTSGRGREKEGRESSALLGYKQSSTCALFSMVLLQ